MRVGRRPSGHWLLFAFCLVALVGMLLVQGISAHRVGASATGPTSGEGATPLAGLGPLLTAGPHGLAPLGGSPGRRIALTFDDGPSARWTPQIERVLERYRVPATFFVVGTQAAHYPDVLRSLYRNGFEIGDHTFTHADPATLSPWQANLQLGLTQSVVAGITGMRPRLFRPPYSSTTAAVTSRQARTYARLARDGYVISLTNYDGEDWQRPGVESIVRNAMPPAGRGGVVLLHDGGGNRGQTVAALDRLIPALERRGYRLVPLSDLAGLPRSAVELSSTAWERLRSGLLVGGLRTASAVTRALTVVVLLVGLLTAVRMLALLGLARRHTRHTRRAAVERGPFAPPVSILVPAHNEEVDIERSVRSLAGSDYPEFEVIVVDDGSEDSTVEIVEGLGLARVRLIVQPNAGKAAALNRGLEAARHDIVVSVDADTVFEPGTVRRLVLPLSDASVGAVSGNTKVANRRGLLGRWQHIEYVMGFNLDRRMYEVLDCMPTVPGAIGAFRAAALAEVGNFSGDTLAEDTDVTIALGRAGWRVVYAEDALAYTEAPDSLRGLWRQRYRWAYGTLQAVWKHRGAVRRADQARIGRRALPYLALFQIVLPFAAPLIDLFALYGLLFLDPLPIVGYWVAFNAFQLVLALYAFRLDRESPRPLWALPAQQLVYRQIMYLVVFQSVVSALRGIRLGWQHIARSGELELPEGRPGEVAAQESPR